MNLVQKLWCLAGVAVAALSAPAYGAVSMKVVAGTSCSPAVAPIPITQTGGSVTVSVCVDATAGEAVCTSGFPILSTNAAANSAGISVTARSNASPLTVTQDTTVLPAVLSNTPVQFGNSVPGTGVQAGGGGANIKVAELVLTVPSGLPSSTTFNFGIDASGEIGLRDATKSDCNDITGTVNSVSPGAGAFSLVTPATPSTAVFTISTPVNVTEGGATANATVTCTGAFASNQTLPVSLGYTTSNNVGNFTTSPASLSFAACGGATQNITVTPRVDDATVQGPVVGGIALTAPAAGVATLGATSSAVVNVADNDTPAVVTVAVAPASATEAGGVLTYTITRTGGNQTVALPVTITPPAASGRYSSTCTSPVNIAANQATATCTVTGIDNAVTDGSVTATVTVTAGANYTVGSPATATGTITDDDGPQPVSVAVSGSPATENGGVLTYTFTRTGNAAQIAAALGPVNITAPAAGARFSTTCGTTISFAAAATTATCTYTGIDNAALDGNVNVAVTVAAGTGYVVGSPATATGVIADNEVGVSVAAAGASITEGGLATFTLSCTGTGTFAVNYTVNTVGTDGAVTPASPANLTCGTPLNVTVQTAQNTTPADSRSLILTIGSVGAGAAVVPGQGSATVAIQDDDGPPPTIPTLGGFGLALLGLLMAGVGGLVQRRRK